MQDVIKKMTAAAHSACPGEPPWESAVEKMLRAALSAASDAGWVLVPKEPTEEMQDNGSAVSFMCGGQRIYTPTAWMAEQYRAMLEKAVKP